MKRPVDLEREKHSPIGQEWLRRTLHLRVPQPAIASFLAGQRRTEIDGDRERHYYPKSYAPEETVLGHLVFMLKYEAFDLGVLVATLKAIDPAIIEDYVRATPTGQYARRLWFFYETFVGKHLNLPDATAGTYVPALDPERFVVLEGMRISRYKISANVFCLHWSLGEDSTKLGCPFVRMTDRIRNGLAAGLENEARTLIAGCDPDILARAVNYLYTKETRSTFDIEREAPAPDRATRFVAALQVFPNEIWEQEDLIQLQNQIVDSRYRATDWRDFQIFVGSNPMGIRDEVEFICPRPEDVASLMLGWQILAINLALDETVHPIIAAAVVAFSFVFIHPFDDGNGRIHRFLIHQMLVRKGFTPPGLIFPVSASILRDRAGYDAVLERFSRPLFEFIDWKWTPDREIEVTNDTADLYRYFDATAVCEYLFDRVADTIRTDLKTELEYVATFDAARRAVQAVVDMPDRRLDLMAQLLLQNSGRLSKAKRPLFKELTDAEIEAMEAAVTRAISGDASGDPGD